MAEQMKDPGIGTKFDEKVRRMINADGSYNVVRKGSSEGIRDIFKYLVEISWFKFFTILFSGYILFNLFFTAVYLFFGFENISGIDTNNDSVFFQVFFFSIQTFTTVGYGTLAPLGFSTQAVAAIEAFVGFLSFSLATGLLYGRFSRPQSKLKFADPFVFSKYEDGYSFKFKLTNLRDVVLQEVEAKIIAMFNKKNNKGEIIRSFYMLPLTLPKIEIMALTWTLVHKIDKESPFWNKTIMLAGLDADSFQRKFGELIECIPHASEVTKLSALCMVCKDGTSGPFTKRMVEERTLELIGGSDIYSAVCRKHLKTVEPAPS